MKVEQISDKKNICCIKKQIADDETFAIVNT